MLRSFDLNLVHDPWLTSNIFVYIILLVTTNAFNIFLIPFYIFNNTFGVLLNH